MLSLTNVPVNIIFIFARNANVNAMPNPSKIFIILCIRTLMHPENALIYITLAPVNGTAHEMYICYSGGITHISFEI